MVTVYLLITRPLCTGCDATVMPCVTPRRADVSDAAKASPSFLRVVISHKNSGSPAVAAPPVFVNVLLSFLIVFKFEDVALQQHKRRLLSLSPPPRTR